MSTKKYPRKKRINKRLYVYMAFVTMAAVHLFAKPIHWMGLKRRLKKANKKTTLRQQLNSSQNSRHICFVIWY